MDEKHLITTALLRRFQLEGEREGGTGQYYALIRRSNGDLLSHHPGSPRLDPMQMLWAAEVLRMLNRELHHDGAWVVCFTHPRPPVLAIEVPKHVEYSAYALMWIDGDGDVQFAQEWFAGENAGFQTFADVIGAGIESTVQKCEASWMTWHLHMREVLDPQPHELIKRAQGQRPSATRH